MNIFTYISFHSCIYSLIIEIGEIILQEHQSGSPMKQGTSPLKQGTPLKKHGSYLERQPVLTLQTFIYIFFTKLHKWSLMYLMYHSFLILVPNVIVYGTLCNLLFTFFLLIIHW